MSQINQLEKRLQILEAHLEQENPILLRAVGSFRKLDEVSRRLGFLLPQESHATRISWWPMVAILGTYSSGKSTFINHYMGQPLQLTGNQAVDDRFTVVCYSKEDEVRVLPGLALDADPRFPFYQISRAVEELAEGEGRRIDAYLQLKTCSSPQVSGKIVIDSPGFDADAQRTAILRITSHIIDLSDLVLVFFDARHPEPGTMHDTLEQLVSKTINRPDSSKFLYILNQIDATAREDNPEDVIASWQRALAQEGLTAGRFYRIYNPDAAIPIEDDNLRQHFESKRDVDLGEINARMRQVGVDRAYRVIAVLERTAHSIEERVVPRLGGLLERWRRQVLWMDGIVFGLIIVGVIVGTLWTGTWEGLSFYHTGWITLLGSSVWTMVVAVAAALLAGYAHFSFRKLSAKRITARLRREMQNMHEIDFVEGLIHAFRRNTRFWRSIFIKNPVGWGPRARRQVTDVLAEANAYVQRLNDTFINPSATNAAGTDAAGTEPAGTEPAGPDPTGTDRAGTNPAGTDAAGTDPAGTDAAGTDAAGTDAAGTDPAGTEPAGPDPTGTDAAGTDAAGTDPAGTEPAGPDPTGTDAAGTDPAGPDPTGTDPAGTDPAGTDAAGTDPAGTNPAGTDPAGTDPAGTKPAGVGDVPLVADGTRVSKW